MANSVMYINQAVVNYTGKGRYYDVPLSDILNPHKEAEDDRTMAEIVRDVWAGIRKKKE